MFNELYDALKEYYKDDEDILVDCLLYLSDMGVSSADDRLSDMGRCLNCGNKLEFCWHREYHSEINAYEDICDVYCPSCDIGEL